MVADALSVGLQRVAELGGYETLALDGLLSLLKSTSELIDLASRSEAKPTLVAHDRRETRQP